MSRGMINSPASGKDYSVMTGATSAAAGAEGLVPTPAAGDQASFLRGDGTWVKLDAKVKATISLSKTSLKFTPTLGMSGTVTVIYTGDGALTAASSDDTVATVSLNGSELTVTAVNDGTATITVSAPATDDYSAAERTITVSVSTASVEGVCWDMNNSSTALSRLTAENDPNGYVSLDITTEPTAAVGTGDGSSPFDDIAPWSGMEEYNVADDGTVTPSTDASFSRSSGNVMVYIPEFWYKIVNDEAGGKRYFYISDKAAEGFEKHPGSGRYVGRYNTASGYVSQTGLAPLVSITRAAARTGSTGKGTGWYQYDFASWCAVWLLYLVEFADWDSQSKVGRGYVDSNSAAISSGSTDSMSYHTGRAEGTDGKTAVQYRHIENPWGNVYDWIDGVNFNAGSVYVCTDPVNYADGTATNYTLAGTKIQSDGWIKSLGYSETASWAFFPTAVGGSASTYIADYAYYISGWRVLRVGGFWSSGSYAGLFYFRADYSASNADSYIGARLLFTP